MGHVALVCFDKGVNLKTYWIGGHITPSWKILRTRKWGHARTCSSPASHPDRFATPCGRMETLQALH